jgi:3-oxoacyl-[acyl-carrier protein] reductase
LKEKRMIDLRGTRALITGGSRGIGAASCDLFARAGAQVAVHFHRDEESARAVHGALPSVPGGAHEVIRADLRRPREVSSLVDQVADSWGSLDCLVNNAGIWKFNALETLDADLLEETWELNVRAPFLVAHAVLGLMKGREDANIVNIASTAGQRGEASYSPYAASKGAMIATTKSWAAELAPAIRVNSVAPGWVDTDMSSSAFSGDGRQQIEATIPLARIATAADIAGAILFLASPLARDITGEILNVNGGGVLCG